MKDEIIELEILIDEIHELQEEQEQLRQDILILWDLYSVDNNIYDEEIHLKAVIIALGLLLLILTVSLIIGLNVSGG